MANQMSHMSGPVFVAGVVAGVVAGGPFACAGVRVRPKRVDWKESVRKCLSWLAVGVVRNSIVSRHSWRL